jgi:hypothetical protein
MRRAARRRVLALPTEGPPRDESSAHSTRDTLQETSGVTTASDLVARMPHCSVLGAAVFVSIYITPAGCVAMHKSALHHDMISRRDAEDRRKR